MQKSFIRNAAAGTVAAAATVAAPLVVFAQQNPINNTNDIATNVACNAGICNTGSLPELVGKLIGAALGLLGVVLVVLVIYAGFLWMTAQGNEEKVKTAKKIITNAVIGMVLIFAAYAITSFVIGALTSAISG